jgi:hypothetical protein
VLNIVDEIQLMSLMCLFFSCKSKIFNVKTMYVNLQVEHDMFPQYFAISNVYIHKVKINKYFIFIKCYL